MQIACTEKVMDMAKCVLNLNLNTSHFPADGGKMGNGIMKSLKKHLHSDICFKSCILLPVAVKDDLLLY